MTIVKAGGGVHAPGGRSAPPRYDAQVAEPPPFPTSVCHGCAHLRLSGNRRGAVFLGCVEPTLPRYLPQPVVRCGRRVAVG